MIFLAGLWQKFAGYVIMVGAALGALVLAYGRGRKAMRDEVTRRVLGQDLENRRVGETVRGSVDDVAGGLHKWERRGS